LCERKRKDPRIENKNQKRDFGMKGEKKVRTGGGRKEGEQGWEDIFSKTLSPPGEKKGWPTRKKGSFRWGQYFQGYCGRKKTAEKPGHESANHTRKDTL